MADLDRTPKNLTDVPSEVVAAVYERAFSRLWMLYRELTGYAEKWGHPDAAMDYREEALDLRIRMIDALERAGVRRWKPGARKAARKAAP